VFLTIFLLINTYKMKVLHKAVATIPNT